MSGCKFADPIVQTEVTSIMFLVKMKETAEAYVGEKANDVVVTVVARTLTTALWTSATGLQAQES